LKRYEKLRIVLSDCAEIGSIFALGSIANDGVSSFTHLNDGICREILLPAEYSKNTESVNLGTSGAFRLESHAKHRVAYTAFKLLIANGLGNYRQGKNMKAALSENESMPCN